MPQSGYPQQRADILLPHEATEVTDSQENLYIDGSLFTVHHPEPVEPVWYKLLGRDRLSFSPDSFIGTKFGGYRVLEKVLNEP